jgi:hypothetical protein
MDEAIRRREFLQQIGAGVVGGLVAGEAIANGGANASETAASAPASRPVADSVDSRPATIIVGTVRDLPMRRLGRTGIQVPMLSFGTAPLGQGFFDPEPFEQVMHAAIDAGIKYIDTARIYDVAEERLKPVLAKRRKEVFLVTKAWAKSTDACLRSLEKSFTIMGIDYADVGHIHNVGDYTTEQAIGKDSCLAGLREAKKRGLIRHIGCTAHNLPAKLIPVLETGEIDVLMVPVNFVDGFTYNFEEKILPIAVKHDCGIVAMKVYGGAGGWGGYKKRQPGRLSVNEHRQDAIDYALSVPGMASLVVGIKTLQELAAAVQAVRNFKPLEGKRRKAVLAKGASMAKEKAWGEHFGPVT